VRSLAVDAWYHAPAAYVAHARTLSNYIDGVMDDGALVGSVPPSRYDGSIGVDIAQWIGFPGALPPGTTSEVHVFNRALTASDL